MHPMGQKNDVAAADSVGIRARADQRNPSMLSREQMLASVGRYFLVAEIGFERRVESEGVFVEAVACSEAS